MRTLRPSLGFALLIALCVIAALIEISTGPMHISIAQIWSQTWAYVEGSRQPDAVVMGAIRWPRLLTAAFVGAGLASAGAVLQALFRNPMADPGIIGVSSGGSLGAVLTITLGLQGVNAWFTPAGAFLGGIITVFVVYALGTIQGRTTVHSLLLSGVAISAFSSALVTFLLSLAPLQTMQQILFWLMGGLDGSTWTHVLIVMVGSLLAICVFLSQARALDVFSIGEEQAEGVGVNPQRLKRLLLAASAVVVGACVSVSGIIGFVGLIVPHIIRIWLGPRHRVLIPAAAIGGALLVIVSDIAARLLFAPVELNIGVITSCLGAPFFLYLLRSHYSSVKRRG